jgi:hypothetical protein
MTSADAGEAASSSSRCPMSSCTKRSRQAIAARSAPAARIRSPSTAISRRTKRSPFDAFDLRTPTTRPTSDLHQRDAEQGRHPPSSAPAQLVLIATTPGVGLEPTTSRLTVERICQIELPRIGLPRINLRAWPHCMRAECSYASRISPASTSAWQFAQSSAHLRASTRAFSRDRATPRWLSEKLFSAGTR